MSKIYVITEHITDFDHQMKKIVKAFSSKEKAEQLLKTLEEEDRENNAYNLNNGYTETYYHKYEEVELE